MGTPSVGTLSPQLLRALLAGVSFNAFVEKAFAALAPGQTFVPSWHLQAIAYQLERLRRREITRLILDLPPRSLKSVTASVAFPALTCSSDTDPDLTTISSVVLITGIWRRTANDFRALRGSSLVSRSLPGVRIGQKDFGKRD